MAKFKGYDMVDVYPEDGWLRGYFYAMEEDIRNHETKQTKAYRDTGAIRHKDFVLHLLKERKSRGRRRLLLLMRYLEDY